MFPKGAQSLAGQKMAPIIRKKAVDNYYTNPNICKNCNNIIQVSDNQKVSEVKRKQFCNHNCAAAFNNKDRKKPKLTKEQKEKIRQEKFIEKWKYIKKGDFFKKCKNYFSARCTITKFAKTSMKYSGKQKVCRNCGYDKHVEICHIKSVSDFNDSSTLYEINNSDNLIYLCPNCHWEFDNNILKLQVV